LDRSLPQLDFVTLTLLLNDFTLSVVQQSVLTIDDPQSPALRPIPYRPTSAKMQLITLLSAAAAVTTVSANAVAFSAEYQKNPQAHARVVNRCNYPVHLWSVYHVTGCPIDQMITLQTGESYTENYQNQTDGVGISIKISKDKRCNQGHITQLEYLKNGYGDVNYIDVSYVDCGGLDCPTRQDGYYLIAGTQTGKQKASIDNRINPVLSCHDQASCDKISYVLPDDRQTRSCMLDANMDFYMCGGQAPSDSDDSAISISAPPKPSTQVSTSTPQPSTAAKPTTTLHKVVSSSAAGYEAKAQVAAVTPAPEIKEDKPKAVKTEIVYVTAYEYVNAKRDAHAHGHAHARRLQPFNA
jgi:hypothetical protein